MAIDGFESADTGKKKKNMTSILDQINSMVISGKYIF